MILRCILLKKILIEKIKEKNGFPAASNTCYYFDLSIPHIMNQTAKVEIAFYHKFTSNFWRIRHKYEVSIAREWEYVKLVFFSFPESIVFTFPESMNITLYYSKRKRIPKFIGLDIEANL